MSRSTCNKAKGGCGAIIRWLKTAAGKNMPVDPTWLSEWVTDEPYGESPRKVSLMSGDGRGMQSGYVASVIAPGARQIEGYTPHHSTCPKADRFKRRGQ